jgi:hypothetical protein
MSIILDGTTGITTPGLINTGSETVVNLTTSGNTTLGDATTDTLNVGAGGLVKDASGNVGIGTASPAQKLHVASAGTVAIRVQNTASSGSAATNYINTTTTCNVGVDGVGGYIETLGAYATVFYTNSVQRMIIDSSGNVGIGTSSPNKSSSSTALTVNTGTAANYSAVEWASGNTLNYHINTNDSAIYHVAAGTRPWIVYTNGSERMRIDSSGNVGFGTSSPSYRVDVVNNATGTQLNIASSSGFGTSLQLVNTATNGRSYRIGSNFTTGTGELAFYDVTAAAERMRIDSSGNLLVGTTSSSTNVISANKNNDQALYVFNTNSSSPFGVFIQYPNLDPNSTGSSFIDCFGISTRRMGVRSNGGISNYSGNDVNLSDAREKTNIELAGSYLDKICAIPVKTFNYIDQNLEEDDGLTLGVIAQDVEAVAPELVMESNWGSEEEPKMRLSIYQTDLQYALMKCIQEQQALINDLTTRLTALENK